MLSHFDRTENDRAESCDYACGFVIDLFSFFLQMAAGIMEIPRVKTVGKHY